MVIFVFKPVKSFVQDTADDGLLRGFRTLYVYKLRKVVRKPRRVVALRGVTPTLRLISKMPLQASLCP